MGNISIDSKSLRPGYDGPAYAAPVVRKVAVENAQPKNFKVSTLLNCIDVNEIQVYIGSATCILKEEVILVLTWTIKTVASYRHQKSPGARFSKVPRTFRAGKAIRKTTTCLFCKAGLFICCKGNKNKNNCEVSCLETPLF